MEIIDAFWINILKILCLNMLILEINKIFNAFLVIATLI